MRTCRNGAIPHRHRAPKPARKGRLLYDHQSNKTPSTTRATTSVQDTSTIDDSGTRGYARPHWFHHEFKARIANVPQTPHGTTPKGTGPSDAGRIPRRSTVKPCSEVQWTHDNMIPDQSAPQNDTEHGIFSKSTN